MKTLISKAIGAIALAASILVSPGVPCRADAGRPRPAASADATATKASLFDRLGGLKGIAVVVDDFIDRLVANETLNQNPAINAGRIASPAPYLKLQVSQLVCKVTGGPCKYTGKGMKESHAHLNISEKEWGVMADEFQRSLDKFKVPAAEQNELFEIVGTTHPDIVTRK